MASLIRANHGGYTGVEFIRKKESVGVVYGTSIPDVWTSLGTRYSKQPHVQVPWERWNLWFTHVSDDVAHELQAREEKVFAVLDELHNSQIPRDMIRMILDFIRPPFPKYPFNQLLPKGMTEDIAFGNWWIKEVVDLLKILPLDPILVNNKSSYDWITDKVIDSLFFCMAIDCDVLIKNEQHCDECDTWHRVKIRFI